jgi:hypothetical protein
MTNRRALPRKQLVLFTEQRASSAPMAHAREELIAILSDLLLEALGPKVNEEGGDNEREDHD